MARPLRDADPRLRLFARALWIWLLILIAAFANGALREMVLAPALGAAAAEALSAVLLCAIIVLAAWWLVGTLWVALAAGFELGFSHYVMSEPLAALLAAYDPRYGYFGFVQLTTLLAPPVLARLGRRGRPHARAAQ